MVVTDEELVRLWDSGLSMTEIGDQVGLSRERVRQRLRPYGRKGANPNSVPSPEDIRKAITQEFSYPQVSRLLGVSIERLMRGIERAGLKDEVEEAFQARDVYWAERAREREQRRLIPIIRQIAREVGHTPSQSELAIQGVYHMTLTRAFGSAADAMRAAGLEPNIRGRPPLLLPDDFDVDSPDSPANVDGAD